MRGRGMRAPGQRSAASGNLTAADADTSRLRLVLEGSRRFAVGEAGALTPSLEVGLRHDGGDAETGTGIEVGGGVRYSDPASGLSVEAKARGLVAHEEADYREWGASGSVRIEPGASARGLSLTLSPAWGAASAGAERLWSARDARGLAPDGEFEAGSRLEAEIGRMAISSRCGGGNRLWTRSDDWTSDGVRRSRKSAGSAIRVARRRAGANGGGSD